MFSFKNLGFKTFVLHNLFERGHSLNRNNSVNGLVLERMKTGRRLHGDGAFNEDNAVILSAERGVKISKWHMEWSE